MIAEGEDGLATRLAFGEWRLDDGVFAVDPDGVLDEGKDVEIAGIELSSMAGGLLNFEDLNLSELDFEWADEDTLSEADADECAAADSHPRDGMTIEETETQAAEACESNATRTWRECACDLQDQLQWHHDELQSTRDELQLTHNELQSTCDALRNAQGQCYAEMLMSCNGAEQVRCRVEIPDPGVSRDTKSRTKLIPLEELLRDCLQKGESLPILTSTERLRREQQAKGMYKANYAHLSENLREQMELQLAAKDAELAANDEEHHREIELQQQRHNEELQRRDAQHAFAVRFQARSLNGQAAAQREAQAKAAAHLHKQELVARAKRAATWTKKRRNMSRSLRRTTATRDSERERADANAADLHAMDADSAELNAEVGQSVKIAEQRQNRSARGAFTFQTINRALHLRQCSLLTRVPATFARSSRLSPRMRRQMGEASASSQAA